MVAFASCWRAVVASEHVTYVESRILKTQLVVAVWRGVLSSRVTMFLGGQVLSQGSAKPC